MAPVFAGPRLLFLFDRCDDCDEAFYRFEVTHRFNGPIEIERHVLVDDHVAKARQRFERSNEIGRKARIAWEAPPASV